MKNVITVMKKELFRFFSDKRMIFTTIIMPGLMIYIMYTIMGQAIMSKENVNKSYQPNVYTYGMPTSYENIFSGMTLENKNSWELSEDEIKAQVKDKKIDALVIFSDNFENEVEKYDAMTSTKKAPQIQIYYNSSKKESLQTYKNLENIFNTIESSMANKFDINSDTDRMNNKDVSDDKDKYDLASDEDMTAQVFSMLFPMLLVMFIFSGCMSIAPDSIAGEKERGTLTTVLVTPIKRSELALGKITALSILALLSGISSFIGTALSLPKIMGKETENINTNVYGAADYGILLLIVLCTVLIIISLISIISANSKSVKEAASATTPFMLVSMALSFTSMFGDGAVKEFYWYMIPIYNSVQSMGSVFQFAVNPLNIAITFISNIVYAGIMIYVLAKMFNSEKIVFSK